MAVADLTCGNIYEIIDGFAPFETCEAWDNSGLLSGRAGMRVTGIYCALDVSIRVIEDALSKGANLIVTHHPIMFGGRKNLSEDDAEGRMLCALIRNGLCVISAHTNFDKADGGVSDILAGRIGLRDVHKPECDEEGYLRIGVTEALTLSEFAARVRTALGDAVRVYGEPDRLVRTVCVCGGAGGEYAALSRAAGADAYLTGEMRYHDSFDLAQEGFATLQAGHDATERIAVGALKQRIENALRERNTDIPVYLSDVDCFSLRSF
ncbi:MAG: Nif3-like dinuclear metal center hexameric protein [Clostridia bacterium]|nr:Nif3-like dinuclear metal center hexameric protein [Clostridia bacterium]